MQLLEKKQTIRGKGRIKCQTPNAKCLNGGGLMVDTTAAVAVNGQPVASSCTLTSNSPRPSFCQYGRCLSRLSVYTQASAVAAPPAVGGHVQ